MERARRQEEIDLLREAWAKKSVEDQAYAEKQAKVALEQRKAAHQALLKAKSRLARCKGEADNIRSILQKVCDFFDCIFCCLYFYVSFSVRMKSMRN